MPALSQTSHVLKHKLVASSLCCRLTVNRVNDAAYMAVLVDVTKLAMQERRLMADQQRFRAICARARLCDFLPFP